MRRRAPSLPLRALHTRPLMLSAAFFGFGALLARDGRLPQGVLLVCAAVLLLAWCLLHLRGRRCAALLVACACLLYTSIPLHADARVSLIQRVFALASRTSMRYNRKDIKRTKGVRA